MEELKSTPNDDGRGRLKQLFDQEEAAPMPQTWAAIESHVQKPNRKGAVLWWSMALVGLLTLVGTLYWNVNRNEQISLGTTQEHAPDQSTNTPSSRIDKNQNDESTAGALSQANNATAPNEPEPKPTPATEEETKPTAESEPISTTSPKPTQGIGSTPVVVPAEEKTKPRAEANTSIKTELGKAKTKRDNGTGAVATVLAPERKTQSHQPEETKTQEVEISAKHLKSLKSKSGTYKAPLLKGRNLNLNSDLKAGSLLAQTQKLGTTNGGHNNANNGTMGNTPAPDKAEPQSTRALPITTEAEPNQEKAVTEVSGQPAITATSTPEKPAAEVVTEAVPPAVKSSRDTVAHQPAATPEEKQNNEKLYRFWLSAQLMRTQHQMTVGQSKEANISAFTLSPNGRVAAGISAQYALLSRAKWSVWAGAHIRYQQWQANYTQRQETGFKTLYSGNEMTLVPTYAFSQHELSVREWQVSPTISTRISVWKPIQLGLSASYLLSVNQSMTNNTGDLKVNRTPGHILLSPSVGYSIGPWQADLGVDWPLGSTQNAGQVQWQQQSYFFRVSRFW